MSNSETQQFESSELDDEQRAYCVVCDQYRELSDYSLHVRAWDGRHVCKAAICEACVEDIE